MAYISMSLCSFTIHTLLLISCGCLLNLVHCDPKLTAKDEIKLHHLFKRYNKPAVQEIKTIHGDIYSCVDFYKQPAFDHPLLKNRSYHQELMSSMLLDQRPRNVSQEKSIYEGLWENGIGCPNGTIPLQKYTKDQFNKMHTLFQRLYPVDDPIPNRYRACVHTREGSRKFFGTLATLSIHNYPVDPTQYTAGYQIIRAGNDQFQFGWMINPGAYGDGQTRFFLSTKVEHARCFNLMCGGFVHTNKDLPLDRILTPTTKRRARITYEINPLIIRESNVWKLYVLAKDGYRMPMGYWPNEVLKGLAGPAEYLEWGGEVYNPNNLKGPGMGSGYFPVRGINTDGYVRRIKGVDETGAFIELPLKDTEPYNDDHKHYNVVDGIFIDGKNGHTVFYGGPGM